MSQSNVDSSARAVSVEACGHSPVLQTHFGNFEFGMVSVPDGTCGDWSVETFSISAEEARFSNMRAAFGGRAYAMVSPGTYKRLVHERRGVVMSNTPMEVNQARSAYRQATGRILVNGLGLGMILEGMLSKPVVTAVRVVEIDADVLELVGSHFHSDPRVELVHADAYSYSPAKGERFDYVWHDIWDQITPDNLPLMTKLTRKYARRTERQAAWAREECRMHARRGR